MRRPLVTLHYAQSLDGRIGGRRGTPRAMLSGPEGFVRAHRARAAHDAVLVGIGTVLQDDPRLTVRLCEGPEPMRVVLDSALRVPEHARVLDGADGTARVTLLGVDGPATRDRAAALRGRGADVPLVVADPHGRVSLPHALALLADRGVRSVLVEGGSRVITSFLSAGLVDRVEIEIAPIFLGADAVPAVAQLAPSAPELRLAPGATVERAGDSVLVVGRPLAQPPR